MSDLKRIIEAVLFVSQRPVSLKKLRKKLEEFSPNEIEVTLSALIEEYNYGERAVEIAAVAGGYQMRTKRDMKDWVRRFTREKETGLTRSPVEVLAIVAYRQPVSRGEIDRMRGVDSSRTVRQLLDRGLLEIAGRDGEGDRAILFRTTKRFLEVFGIGDLRDLPTLKEFRDLQE